MIGMLLFSILAIWCWFFEGPRFLRWPLLVLIVLVTSGHQLGAEVSAVADAIAAALLPFLLVLAGIVIMLRGGFRRRPHPPYNYRERRDRYGRW